MGKRRLERKIEPYYRMAKRVGYRARSAFKLKQIDQRYNLFKRGDIVVDLGAAPGGWLQVSRERVGEKGFVLGVDLQPIARLPYNNIETIVADITDAATAGLIRARLRKKANVVLSDASPKISGVWDLDHARSIELARAALTIAERVLAPGGKLLVKVFQGKMLGEFVEEVKAMFGSVKITKPAASRKGSAEVYVVAKGFSRFKPSEPVA